MNALDSSTTPPLVQSHALPHALVANEHYATAVRYIKAIENGALDEALACFHPDVEQIEYPNRLVPNGAKRDLAALIAGARRGRGVMAKQMFDIRHATAVGNRVVLELRWIGTLAVPVATLEAGAEMRAYFATVLEFRDGKIVAQRNYDCFDSW